MRLRLLLTLAALVLLTGVWRTTSRLLAPSALASSSAMLVVVRDAQGPAGSLPQTILLDGESIARLRPGDVLRMPVSVGSHSITLACNELATREGSYEVPITFKAGETLSFRSRVIWDQVCLLSFEKTLAS